MGGLHAERPLKEQTFHWVLLGEEDLLTQAEAVVWKARECISIGRQGQQTQRHKASPSVSYVKFIIIRDNFVCVCVWGGRQWEGQRW